MSLPLEDIELIRQLKYRYCRCIDTANMAELRELFAEDASVRYQGGSYLFEAQGRDQINHPEITVTSPTEATGVWYLKDWFCDLRRKIITDGSALYRDTYVKRDGRWLIQRATYERIYEIVTPFEQAPNITAHWLAKHGKRLPEGM